MKNIYSVKSLGSNVISDIRYVFVRNSLDFLILQKSIHLTAVHYEKIHI